MYALAEQLLDGPLSGCCGRKIMEKSETFKEYHIMEYLDLVRVTDGENH
jgi:hypothetical protein